MKQSIIFGILVIILAGSPILAQESDSFRTVTFAERNLGGPRLGLTFVPGSSSLSRDLETEGMRPLLSQFGWHFEWQVIPDGGGPQFVVQLVPLLAGVEYGKVLLSTTLGLGIRLPSGFEFGLGPNLSITGKGGSPALMATIGKSLDYSGVSIPINLVWVTNPDGNRISLIFGYAIAD